MARAHAGCLPKFTLEQKLLRPAVKFLAVLVFLMIVFNLWATLIPIDKSQSRQTNSVGTGRATTASSSSSSRQKVSSIPLILWWDPIPGQEDYQINCSEQYTCQVTTDRQRWKEQDVMMLTFYGPSLSLHELPVARRDGDLWALFHDESPKNMDFFFSHRSVMELFNYTSTFRNTSHFPFPTQWLQDVSEITSTQYMVPVAEKTRLRREKQLAPVVYVQSDCRVPSDRDHFVSMLQDHIAIDSYGACLNNKQFPNGSLLSFASKGDMSVMTSAEFYTLVSQYKFTVAIENAVCADYVTEKFWRPLHLGVVPIVFGAPNIQDFLPSPNSSLLIENFPSVEQLARAIKYFDENDDEYSKLLSYKQTGITNTALLKLIERRSQTRDYRTEVLDNYHCFLCEKLHEAVSLHKSGQPISRSVASKDQFGCGKPGKFNDVGRYVSEVEHGHWNVPWRRSEAMMCAMHKLIDKAERVSKETFESMVREAERNFTDKCLKYVQP